ncbi:caspase family protein [Botrimarina hoheduenensis]|uniref:Caspase domain protein n=1 Tax=Botrimarina hoheduenensis TaxID=2528000 RepID=A0A5C5WAD0_9BACT|nr:caspase family protein [Botrimarina hoheduenensis]TWT47856.1 Caspase domain protein [Botrimarina hoheduenensis]
MNTRPLLLLVAVIGMTGSCLAEEHALVIGVNAVPHFRVGGLMAVRPLRGAEYDAKLFAQTLSDRWGFKPDQVEVLLGKEANHGSVTGAMERIARTAKPEDTVVFYFAGHGTQAPDRAPFDEPSDERLDEALCLSDVTSAGENLLLDDDLASWLRELKVQSVSIVLDCCHSGTGIKGSADQPVERGLTLPAVAANGPLPSTAGAYAELTLLRKANGPRVIALYACESGQSAYERRFATPQGRKAMGQFTRYLLEAMTDPSLADQDTDGRLSVDEAAAYVGAKIDNDFNAGRLPAKQQRPHAEASRGEWDLVSAR